MIFNSCDYNNIGFGYERKDGNGSSLDFIPSPGATTCTL